MLENRYYVLIVYLLIINLLAFALYGIDKRRASKHCYRISEAALFSVALLGGSIGAWAGIYFFRHKTAHWYFVVGIPLILAAQVAVVLWYLLN